MYTEFKKHEIITVDLHLHTVAEAKRRLEKVVQIAPRSIREIVVIHGYHHGTALLNMVRNDFHNRRVSRKILSLNQGVTSLILIGNE